MKKMKRGFTLVELLVVIAILMLLVAAMVGALNPGFQVNKANDARRKKDLGRIKVSFEEYYNDKGCYPNQAIVDTLRDGSNCFKDVSVFPQLRPWVCDPVTKAPYLIVVELGNCPKWFKVFSKLANNADNDIPAGWQYKIGYHIGAVGTTQYNFESSVANYGVSSTNVKWNDAQLSIDCDSTGNGGCNSRYWDNSGTGQWVCKAGDAGASCLYPDNCYAGPCVPQCKVACCPSINGQCE